MSWAEFAERGKKQPRMVDSLRDSFLGRRHSRETKWQSVFWYNFRDFVGTQKMEDLTESFFFRRIISNDK